MIEMYNPVEDMDIPALEEQGVSKDLIPRLAKEAIKDPQTVGNPRGPKRRALQMDL